MKILFRFLLIGICITSCSRSNINNLMLIEADSIRFAHWYHDKPFAFSFVFDDNLPSQHDLIAPLLEKYNFRGTFAIVTGPLAPAYQSLFDSVKNKYLDLYKRGHELANHTLHHWGLPNMSLSSCKVEINEPLNIFRSLGLSRPITCIQPGNQTNKVVDSVLFSSHLISRVSTPFSSNNRLIINVFTGRTFEDFIYNYNLCYKSKKWYIFAGHGVDGNGWEPINSSFLERVCQKVSQDSDNIWVSRMDSVGLYERIYHETKISTSKIEDCIFVKFSNPNFDTYKTTYQISSIKMTLIVPCTQSIKINSSPSFNITYKKIGNQYCGLFDFNVLDTNELIIKPQ